MSKLPWATFCISTYKRPVILQEQLFLLSQQTFTDFEIVVSDNDPNGSAQQVVDGFKDSRFRYFHNEENLGMIRSFNKSIERAKTEFIVMVTDDDPVHPDFLTTFYNLYVRYPGYSMYCGFQRTGKDPGLVEVINREDFVPEILDPRKTGNLLWSSAVVNRKDVIEAGYIPEFGSPHLADHAFLALVGSVNGGVVVNQMFSHLSSHDSNFSKTNLHYYVSGCEGFYKTMQSFAKKQARSKQYEKAIDNHLEFWMFSVIAALRNYYTFTKPDQEMMQQVSGMKSQILSYPFMKKYRFKSLVKDVSFGVRKIKRKFKF